MTSQSPDSVAVFFIFLILSVFAIGAGTSYLMGLLW